MKCCFQKKSYGSNDYFTTCEALQEVEDGFNQSSSPLNEINIPVMDAMLKEFDENQNSTNGEESNIDSSSENDVNPILDKVLLEKDKVSRTVFPGLDEFKTTAFNFKSRSVAGKVGSIIHRLEPGGAEYNYASSSKGAKVLAHNKEAKGASSILSREKDNYLRNPCSADEKFVIIELSEETLVDTIEIANFEHHSSNLKEFELLGSLDYPTHSWVTLGNFTAGNTKHVQRFVILEEPKWVRYLKLNISSHYGSEFYCTLSFLEVYGVDVVEKMLEDLISVQEQKQLTTSQTQYSEADGVDFVDGKSEEVRRQQQMGRIPGDTVLKILMQKVRNLDMSFSVLENYLEELNLRNGKIFAEFDSDIEEKGVIMKQIRTYVKNLIDTNEVMRNSIDELASWKHDVSKQLDNIIRDNAALRVEIEKIGVDEMHMQNKEMVIFFICTVFGGLGFSMVIMDCIFRIGSKSSSSRNFCCFGSSSWVFLLLSCVIIVIILSL
ncbi:SUN domain-containing protein 3-like isoform X2 [Impatiens glandulifera]|uniref:SUN domain-containing protein 3-like isoform X2 n=1 Tax=Impatiens glandulifera TaxID=253017 RepID=UPI001FB19D3E|nr:SUN domain-containing protein 3-like isoform X2 [Impatiens glandulifera]